MASAVIACHAPLRFFPASTSAKKIAQDRGTIFREDFPLHLDPMIEFRVAEDRKNRTACACFWVTRPKNHPPKTGLHNGSGTHCARLNCNIEGTARQTVVPKLPRGSAQSEDFRMGRGVVKSNRTVVGPRHNPTVQDNDCADRDLVFPGSALRFSQSVAHKLYSILFLAQSSVIPAHRGIVARPPA